MRCPYEYRRNFGGGGSAPLVIFFVPKNSFLATNLKKDKNNEVRVTESVVCILRTGSNQSSPSF
jgi:hypothetical protein